MSKHPRLPYLPAIPLQAMSKRPRLPLLLLLFIYNPLEISPENEISGNYIIIFKKKLVH